MIRFWQQASFFVLFKLLSSFTETQNENPTDMFYSALTYMIERGGLANTMHRGSKSKVSVGKPVEALTIAQMDGMLVKPKHLSEMLEINIFLMVS